LLIDWRWGERFFMQHLIDGDPAANNGGWQWTAGTGTDAAPYFRIFNPVLQSKKFDPNGDYIRKWVPELAHLDSTIIHAPWEKKVEVYKILGDSEKENESKERIDKIKAANGFIVIAYELFNNKDFESAKSYFEYAVAYDPDNFNTYNDLGVVYKKLENYEKAIESYEKAYP